MNTHQHSLLAIVMLALASGPVAAESQQSKQDQVRWAYKTQDLIDHKVISDNGDELGTISELIFDKSGKISYFVLARGGMLGINETKVLVPWSALGEVEAVTGTYIATINSAAIENAPKLSPNDLADLTNPDLARQVDKHFRTAGMRESGVGTTMDSEKIRQQFSKYDKDGNGMLSKEEAQAAAGLASSFQSADGDNDGTISRAEFARYIVSDQ